MDGNQNTRRREWNKTTLTHLSSICHWSGGRSKKRCCWGTTYKDDGDDKFKIKMQTQSNVRETQKQLESTSTTRSQKTKKWAIKRMN